MAVEEKAIDNFRLADCRRHGLSHFCKNRYFLCGGVLQEVPIPSLHSEEAAQNTLGGERGSDLGSGKGATRRVSNPRIFGSAQDGPALDKAMSEVSRPGNFTAGLS